MDTRAARTLLVAPSSASLPGGAEAAFAPAPPGSSHESEPGVPRPWTLSWPHSGPEPERPLRISFLLSGAPFWRALSAPAPCSCFLPPGGSGSWFIQPETIVPFAAVQVKYRGAEKDRLR